MILLDVVGNAIASRARTIAAIEAFQDIDPTRFLIAAQEGVELDWLKGVVRELGCGVFIGGRGWDFKVAMLKTLRPLTLPWVHVGRVRSEAQFAACAMAGAHAVDSMSWLRAQHHNRAKLRELTDTLLKWAHPRAGHRRVPEAAVTSPNVMTNGVFSSFVMTNTLTSTE